MEKFELFIVWIIKNRNFLSNNIRIGTLYLCTAEVLPARYTKFLRNKRSSNVSLQTRLTLRRYSYLNCRLNVTSFENMPLLASNYLITNIYVIQFSYQATPVEETCGRVEKTQLHYNIFHKRFQILHRCKSCD